MLTSEQIKAMMDAVEAVDDEDTFTGHDDVYNPAHYDKGAFEVIDVIDACTPDPYSYYMGNVIKYLLRHMDKGNPAKDLGKAQWYLNKMLDEWDDV